MIIMTKNNYISIPACIVILLSLFSCNDYLDREPLSNVTPDNYLKDESQLAAYAINQYNIFPTHSSGGGFGTFETDGDTDNMARGDLSVKFVPGLWLVPDNGGSWSFSTIYKINYFLDNVVPRYEANEITGTESNIKHYIGEMYFLRAYEYFNKVQALGDFPIIKKTLPDDASVLTEASRREPRSEVVRFILSDLDQAIALLKETAPDGKKNRINKATAHLFKSRVALFEATWLKYFKGTAFVPDGDGWPGKNQYGKTYQYQAGSIDKEIEELLSLAMASSKTVADALDLVPNTGILESLNNENPYYSMFSEVDLSPYEEVILWRRYDRGLGITHPVANYAHLNNSGVGLTRGLVENFLMNNGLPIYASGSGYAGDDYIADIRENRDGRLWLFLKEPGQKNTLKLTLQGSLAVLVEPYPTLAGAYRYTTGYTIRKGLPYDGDQCVSGSSYTGSIIFRASEAYLNYMEASYEKTGSIDQDAANYWKKLRQRARIDDDFTKTIAATDMSKEALNDWGAYSAGKLINPVLYNIRRERRMELMAEALRYMDLKRWKAMDQLQETAYHFDGFKLWGPMQEWYPASMLKYGDNATAVVSDPALSNYLRPHEINTNSRGYNGASWTQAHYLDPIAAGHFSITSKDGNPENSIIYQNPGWSKQGGSSPK